MVWLKILLKSDEGDHVKIQDNTGTTNTDAGSNEGKSNGYAGNKRVLDMENDTSAGGQSQGPFLLAWVILCPGGIGYGGRILQVQIKHPSHFYLNLNVCEGQKSRLPSPPSSLSHLSSPTRPTLPMAPSSTGSSGSCSIGRQIAFPLSERSRRTFWCTRGIWLICREDFLLWHPLVICPPTLLKLSINSSIQHNTIIIESSLYYHHLISTDAGRLKAAEESKYHAKTHH